MSEMFFSPQTLVRKIN